jgi:hypothetical protein
MATENRESFCLVFVPRFELSLDNKTIPLSNEDWNGRFYQSIAAYTIGEIKLGPLHFFGLDGFRDYDEMLAYVKRWL